MYFSRVYPHWFHRLVWLLWKTYGWNIGSDPKKMRIKMHLQFGSALAGGRQNNMPQLYAARKKHPQPKNPAWHHGTDWQIIFGFGKKKQRFMNFHSSPFRVHDMLSFYIKGEQLWNMSIFTCLFVKGAQPLPQHQEFPSTVVPFRKAPIRPSMWCLHFWIS